MNQAKAKANPKEYVSPLKSKLNLAVEKGGIDVIYHYDRKNKRILIDADIEERQGLSNSLKTIGINNFRTVLDGAGEGKVTVSFNVYDSMMNAQELKKLKTAVENKKAQKQLAKEAKALED